MSLFVILRKMILNIGCDKTLTFDRALKNHALFHVL